MNLLERLRGIFGAAVPAGADRAAFEKAVRPATDPKFGDYQANGCMALAKALGRSPRDLAQEVARTVDLAPTPRARRWPGPGSSMCASTTHGSPRRCACSCPT